jgi:hypothetical protein
MGQPVQFAHGSLPTRKIDEREWQAQERPQQNPRSFSDFPPPGLRGVDYLAFQHHGWPEQARQLVRRRPEHRVNGVAMVWVTVWDGNENQPARAYDFHASAGEDGWIANMLQNIAAKDRLRAQSPDPR